jgi:hypothetical protein
VGLSGAGGLVVALAVRIEVPLATVFPADRDACAVVSGPPHPGPRSDRDRGPTSAGAIEVGRPTMAARLALRRRSVGSRTRGGRQG